MTLDQVRKLLLREAKKHQTYKNRSGIYSWCKANSVARSHANEFLNGKRLPTTDLLEALNLEWRVMPKRRPKAEDLYLSEGWVHYNTTPPHS